MQYFATLTKVDITSPIISIVVGSEEAALRAGRFTLWAPNVDSALSLFHVPDIYIPFFKINYRHLLRSGFHVTPIRPPTVPPNSCRFNSPL